MEISVARVRQHWHYSSSFKQCTRQICDQIFFNARLYGLFFSQRRRDFKKLHIKPVQDMISQILNLVHQIDSLIVRYLSCTEHGALLISTIQGRVITEMFIVGFICVSSYEILYWSGIHLNLWQYHAKEIFQEIAVHCAHVYVNVNAVRREDCHKLERYLESKQDYSLTSYEKDEIKTIFFLLDKPVRYHLEFGPDDFEHSSEPEYGCSLIHLRRLILGLVNDSPNFSKHLLKERSTCDSIMIFNKKRVELARNLDETPIVKCGIETGNVIQSIVQI